MASYTRQSTFSDGDLITAALFNNEYNQLVDAFNNVTGHKHDGTVGEGPVIGLIGDAGVVTPLNKILVDTTNDHIEFWIDVSGTSTQQFYVADGAIVPVTDNDVDLGTSSLQFKDLYINGTANIDSLVANTADINGGTIDGVTIGGSSAGAITGTTITGTSFVIGSASINETELEILDGATLTTTELNYVDGVTSSIQTQIDTKAPLSSPSLTGIPTAPTASANTNTTQVATTAYVQTEITDLIGAAPGTLDTLNELAAAINDDANYNTTLTTALATKLPLAGGTMTGDVTYSDNVKAQFGTSQDLQIYHDGSHSYISENGTGNLILKGGGQILLKSPADENMIVANGNGAVNLFYDNAAKLATTSTGIDVTGVITTDGLTTSADINFGDDDKAIFGTGSDLQIYHDGSNSNIVDTGTGYLSLRGTDLRLQDSSGWNFVICTDLGQGGEVALLHSNIQKLKTTSTGIDVTGTVVSDSALLSSTSGGILTLEDSDATSTFNRTEFSNSAGTLNINTRQSNGTFVSTDYQILKNASGSTLHRLLTQNKKRLDIGSGGDISFYEDTGTTAKLFWDASAESLGIGTTSPSANLHVSSTGDTILRVTSANGNGAFLDLGDASDTDGGRIVYDSGSNLAFYTASTERARFLSGGAFLIGKTALGVNNTGLQFNGGLLAVTKDGGEPLILNRKTTDGVVVDFRKDNTSVGRTVSFAGDLIIQTGITGLRFNDANDAIHPVIANGTVSDGATDLGLSNAKFKDLYLSGTANFGSLSDGTITITGFADEDNMVSNSATLVPTQQSVKAYVDSQISSAGGNGISFEDNEKAQFGDGNDLQIYHDGSNSIIKDAGAGNLELHATNLIFKNSAGDSQYASFFNGGAVTLRYAGAPKLATTSTGIDVTGTVTSDGFTVEGDATIKGGSDVSNTGATLQLESTETQAVGSGASISFKGDDGSGTQRVFGVIKGSKTSATSGEFNGGLDFFTRVTAEGNARKRLAIASNGDISFYDDTGSTQGLFWDASAESLGIGTTSPTAKLHVKLGGVGDDSISLVEANGSATYGVYIKSVYAEEMGRVGALSQADGGLDGASIAFKDYGRDIVFNTHEGASNSEKVRIKKDGNVGIGTSVPSYALDVRDDSNILLQLASTTASNNARMVFAPNNTAIFNVGVDVSSSAFTWYDVQTATSPIKIEQGAATNSLVLKSDGKLGIGTGSANAPLHVKSSIDYITRFESTDTTAGIVLQDSSSSSRVTNTGGNLILSADINNEASNSAIRFMLDTSSNAGTDAAMVLKSTGLGIGIPSPNSGSKLHIRGTDGASGASTNVAANEVFIENNGNVGITLGTPNTGTGYYAFADSDITLRAGIFYDHSTDDMGFRVASSTAMTIDSNRNVGIGTSSPSTTLELSNGFNAPILRLSNENNSITAGGDLGVIEFYSGDNSNSGDSVQASLSVIQPTTDNVSGEFVFKTSNAVENSGALTERLRIAKDGSVGIGTDSPSAKLEVVDSGVELKIRDTRIQTFNAGDIISTLGFYSDDGSGNSGAANNLPRGAIDVVTSNTFGSKHDMVFRTRKDESITASEKLRITSEGEVGIGTTSPGAALHISGTSADQIRLERTNHDTFRIGLQSAVGLGFHNVTDNRTDMMIKGDGNVGIGTVSPSSLLHLSSSAPVFTLTSTSGNGGTHTIKSTGINGDALQITAENDIYLNGDNIYFRKANETQHMRLTSTGNLGIGTSSPSAKLHIDTGGDEGIRIQRTGTNANFAAIEFRNSDDTATNSKIGWNSNELRLEATSTYRVVTNSSDALLIDSSGNVGIGTASPARNLHVHASNFTDLHLTNDTTGATASDGTSFTAIGSDIYLTNREAGNMVFQTSGTERARIDSSGNLAIGNISAAAKLDIRQDSGSAIRCEDGSGAYFVVKQGGLVGIGTPSPDAPLTVHNSSDPEIRFGYSSTQDHKIAWDSSKVFIHADPENANGSSAIGFAVDGTERARIDSSGNFGIGTDSPDALLHLSANTGATLRLESTDTAIAANEVMGAIEWEGNDATTGSSGIAGKIDVIAEDATPEYSMRFFTQDNLSGTYELAERMRIKSDGSVGIGITSPTETLHVMSGVSNDTVAIISGSQSDRGLTISTYASDGRTDGGVDLDAYKSFKFTTDGTERARIDSSGNLLVGTANTFPPSDTGNEGVAVKPDNIAISRNASTPLFLDRMTSDGTLVDFRRDNTTVGNIGCPDGANGSQLVIAAGPTGTNTGVGLRFTSFTVQNIIPCYADGSSADDYIDLGNAGARFDDIYATNGTIQTSDRNDKQDIEEITDAETRVAVACKGLIRKFRWKSAVAEKDDNSDSDETARIHFGIIAQDLQDAFTAEGLDAGNYAMFTSQTWEDSDGVEQTRLGVRYSELLAFIIAAI